LLVNLARGGVVKLFGLPEGRPLLVDSGLVGELDDGTVFTSQWIDPTYERDQEGDTLHVAGACHRVPTETFTPGKMMAFRTAMLTTGWNARMARELKGWIRALLMTRARRLPVSFQRWITIGEEHLEVRDEVSLAPGARVRRLKIGDELPLRYVPQSRYFQPQELAVDGYDLDEPELGRLNHDRRLEVRRRVRARGSGPEVLDRDGRA
jgi:hypothetical protein